MGGDRQRRGPRPIDEAGDQVQGPRVDHQGQARVEAELGELEGLGAARLVESGADEARLYASSGGDHTGFARQDQVLDAPCRVEAHHSGPAGERTAHSEHSGARVGVGSGDDADHSARVLVVLEGRGGVVGRSARGGVEGDGRGLLRIGGPESQIHAFDPPRVPRGGGQDQRLLVRPHRDGHLRREERTGHLPARVRQAGGDVDGDDGGARRALEGRQRLDRVRQCALQGTANPGSHDPVDPDAGAREARGLPPVQVRQGAIRQVDDGDPCGPRTPQGALVRPGFEQDRHAGGARVLQDGARVERVAPVVAGADQGDDLGCGVLRRSALMGGAVGGGGQGRPMRCDGGQGGQGRLAVGWEGGRVRPGGGGMPLRIAPGIGARAPWIDCGWPQPIAGVLEQAPHRVRHPRGSPLHEGVGMPLGARLGDQRRLHPPHSGESVGGDRFCGAHALHARTPGAERAPASDPRRTPTSRSQADF